MTANPRAIVGIWNFASREGLKVEYLKNMGLKVETEKNQELTRLIGRRLREACARDFDNELPAAIAGGLATLREVETRRADMADGSMTDALAHLGATRTANP